MRETTHTAGTSVRSAILASLALSRPALAWLPETSETRRSCERGAAKPTSADAVRHPAMLLIAEYIPTSSASSTPIEITCPATTVGERRAAPT